ncbi:response regulator [Arcobacteraceae bacterium]|nr:response regulator [Arcobacteraceae bacterium]
MNAKALEQLKDIPILCVEDEDGIRETIVNTLKYYFDTVYEAKDGDEAYEIYKDYHPQIILTDIQMKNCNGIKLVQKIRKNDLTTTIIMLTAHSNEEYLLDLINLNLNHFILKPLNLKKLTEALLKYLQKQSEPIYLNNNLFLDLDKRELHYKKEVIPLRKREKDFLKMLYEKKGLVVKYYEIERVLWHEKEMTEYALKSFIKEIRAKIPINIIKNAPKEGYILECVKSKI